MQVSLRGTFHLAEYEWTISLVLDLPAAGSKVPTPTHSLAKDRRLSDAWMLCPELLLGMLCVLGVIVLVHTSLLCVPALSSAYECHVLLARV